MVRSKKKQRITPTSTICTGTQPQTVLEESGSPTESTPGHFRLVHFKIETCVSIKIPELVDAVFEDRKHLVVLHKGKNENPHWHFQGLTHYDKKELDACLKVCAEGHSKKLAKPGSRPVKQAHKNIDELGYQYMMKEDPPVVVSSCGFTEEELEDLHDASGEYVEQCKNQLYFYLIEKLEFSIIDENSISVKLDAKSLHTRARTLSMDFYIDQDKMPPPNFQKLVLWHMVRIAKQKLSGQEFAVVQLYVSKHM